MLEINKNCILEGNFSCKIDGNLVKASKLEFKNYNLKPSFVITISEGAEYLVKKIESLIGSYQGLNRFVARELTILDDVENVIINCGNVLPESYNDTNEFTFTMEFYTVGKSKLRSKLLQDFQPTAREQIEFEAEQRSMWAEYDEDEDYDEYEEYN